MLEVFICFLPVVWEQIWQAVPANQVGYPFILQP